MQLDPYFSVKMNHKESSDLNVTHLVGLETEKTDITIICYYLFVITSFLKQRFPYFHSPPRMKQRSLPATT